MFLEHEIKFADEIQLNLQAFAKNIQSQMHDMQNSVLSLRSFFNKKAPFMIKEYDNEAQKSYNDDKKRIGEIALMYLFQEIKSYEQIILKLRMNEYYVEDFLVHIF
jgi:hypothetical protein